VIFIGCFSRIVDRLLNFPHPQRIFVFMMKNALRGGVVLGTILLVMATVHAQVDNSDLWRNAPRTSPFHAVRWRDDTPQVQVNEVWYELLALNDVPADQIVAQCKTLDAKDWQKRFEEDLPAVLISLNKEAGQTVTLNLKDLSTQKDQTIKDVPMTKENRQAIWRARHESSATSKGAN
jgi:hypothetical protein